MEAAVELARGRRRQAAMSSLRRGQVTSTSTSPKTSVIRRRPLLKSTGKAYLDCS